MTKESPWKKGEELQEELSSERVGELHETIMRGVRFSTPCLQALLDLYVNEQNAGRELPDIQLSATGLAGYLVAHMAWNLATQTDQDPQDVLNEMMKPLYGASAILLDAITSENAPPPSSYDPATGEKIEVPEGPKQ